MLNARNSSYTNVCNDKEYVELLFATLTAWGMNRSGGGPKLQDFEAFTGSLQDPQFVECLDSLKGIALAGLETISTVEERVHRAYQWLEENNRILKTDKALVGVAKTLQHLLPELLMPIDGLYV